jgi:VCBS repeat-containing protein
VGSDSAAKSLVETDELLSTTGTMSLTDLDLNDPANATRTSVKVIGFDGGFNNDHFLGMLKLSTETAQNGEPLRVNEPHNVRWKFDSFATDDFDYLAKEEILKLEYTIEVKDSLGATSQEVVAVSIAGTNDAPKIFMREGGSSSGSILNPTQDVTGSFTIFDEDVLTSDFVDVKFDGVSITDAELKSVVSQRFSEERKLLGLKFRIFVRLGWCK